VPSAGAVWHGGRHNERHRGLAGIRGEGQIIIGVDGSRSYTLDYEI
jgi:hypothetical protein